MIKRNVLATILLGLISSSACFATFEYEGIFASERKSNDPQTYYILLNENTDVCFNLRDSNGEICKNVFVSQIKLSSDDTQIVTSSTGISNYKVTTTGIYEVEVRTNEPISNSVSYKLKVDDNQIKPEEITTNQTVIENKVIDETQTTINTASETKPTEVVTAVKDSEPIINTLQATSSEDIEQIQDTETFFTTVAEPLGPDTEAVEDVNSTKPEEKTSETINAEPLNIAATDTSIIVEKKKVNLTGKLVLSKTIDIYDFMSDKNKCWPKSVCFDNNGNIWVLDGQLNKIHCYDSNGSEKKAFGSKGKDEFALGIPVSIACINNKVLVGDRQKHCIHIFDTEGNWLSAIKSNPNLGLKITNPVSIFFRNNEIWIGDNGTNRMLCFDSSFAFLGSFGSTNEGKIESISAVSTDGNSIFILEEEGCIKRFGPMGNFESAFATEISFGNSIFIDNSQNIWVVDSEKGGVTCFNYEGKTIYSITRDNLKDLFENSNKFSPSAISINNNAQIAITDTYSKQVKFFEIK